MLLDAAVLAFLAASALIGAMAGLIRPLFLFAGAALGWLAARHLSAPVGDVLARALPSGAARPVAAVLLFTVVTVAVAIAGRKLARAPEGGGRPLDRGAGALLEGSPRRRPPGWGSRWATPSRRRFRRRGRRDWPGATWPAWCASTTRPANGGGEPSRRWARC